MLNRIAILAIAALLPLTGGAYARGRQSRQEPTLRLRRRSRSQGRSRTAKAAPPLAKYYHGAGRETKVDDDPGNMPNTGKYAITFKDVPKNKGTA